MTARVLLALTICQLSAACANGETIFLTTTATETFGGISVRDGDIAEYDTDTDTATIFFDEDLFAANEEVDAFQVISQDVVLLSTLGAAELGGLSFTAADIVQYNFTTGVATEFFSGSLFSATENINAFHVLNDGTILISTTTAASLGGVSFTDGDIVRYNPMGNTATPFFDEDLFAANEDIDGLYRNPDGTLLLSTVSSASLGGITFSQDDVVLYNPSTNMASVFVDEAIFSNGANINGISVPSPSTAILGAAGLLALISVCARHRR